MPNKTLLLEYAKLKIQISDLEEKAQFLKDSVLAEVLAIRGSSDSPVQLSELPGFSFTTQKRKSWTYPESITEAEKSVKEMKKNAEATGDATFIENEILVISTKKE